MAAATMSNNLHGPSGSGSLDHSGGSMCKQALGAFEQTDLGEWHCFKEVTVVGRTGTVRVPKGTVIRRRTVYAGYDDFGQYLESVAVDVAGSVRYQLSAE